MKGHENIIPPKKGEVRNPKGRGKGHLNVKTRMLKLFKVVVEQQNPLTGNEEKFTVAEMLDMAIVGKALSGDVPAYREIMDRVEGKVTTSIEVENINPTTVQLIRAEGVVSGQISTEENQITE